MIETIVALAVVAVALVAITQMGLNSIRTSSASANQMLANDAAVMYVERMRANDSRVARSGSYNWPQAGKSCSNIAPVDCGGSSAVCTPEQLAGYDIKQSLCASSSNMLGDLPGNEVMTSICGNYGSAKAICTITVSWYDLIQDRTQTHTLAGVVL